MAVRLDERPPRDGGADEAVDAAVDDVPMRPARFARGDLAMLAGCFLSATSLTYLVFYRLAPVSGAVGFWISSYAVFLVIYRIVEHEREGARRARDRMMNVVVATTAFLVLVPLALIVGYVVWKGFKGLTVAFFTKDLEVAGPGDPYDAGGVLHAIVGTLEQVALAVAISVPLGLMCAVFLNEVGGPLRRPVRIFVDAMSGVPTIVAGLFIYSIWEVSLHHGFSGFAAAMAISISMLPVITRTAEEVLRLVPDGLREASLALGTSQWKTVSGVVLPTARTGLITACILGVARAVGETAPLIMTSFGSAVMNANPFSDAQASLPIFIFRNYALATPPTVQRAWSAALVLITLVLILFTAARILGGQLTPGRRRVSAAATADPAD